jgi:hypothetical protein
MAKEERGYTETLLLAQLTISVDQYIRDTGIARPKPRSIDKMLSDVGLKTADIANLLGKTERAVNMQLASDGKTKKKPDNKSVSENKASNGEA